MEELLKKSLLEKEYLCIHMDAPDTGRFAFGRIFGLDHEYVAILLVAPEGIDDGILVKRIADILFIERGNKYKKKMSELMRCANYKERSVPTIQHNVLQEAMSYAKKEEMVVTLEVAESGREDSTGFIKSFGNNICEVYQIDEYGDYDGKAFIRSDEISQLCIDSSSERIVHSLFKSKTKA